MKLFLTVNLVRPGASFAKSSKVVPSFLLLFSLALFILAFLSRRNPESQTRRDKLDVRTCSVNVATDHHHLSRPRAVLALAPSHLTHSPADRPAVTPSWTSIPCRGVTPSSSPNVRFSFFFFFLLRCSRCAEIRCFSRASFSIRQITQTRCTNSLTSTSRTRCRSRRR